MKRSTFKKIVEEIFHKATPNRRGNITLFNFNESGWNRTYQFSNGKVEARNWRDRWADQDPEVFTQQEELAKDLLQYEDFAVIEEAMTQMTQSHSKAKLYPPSSA